MFKLAFSSWDNGFYETAPFLGTLRQCLPVIWSSDMRDAGGAPRIVYSLLVSWPKRVWRFSVITPDKKRTPDCSDAEFYRLFANQ